MSERMTYDISADLRSKVGLLNEMHLDHVGRLLTEAADKLDGLIADLATAENARDAAQTERWRMKEALDRGTASFDKEIAEAAADVTRLAAERDAARAALVERTSADTGQTEHRCPRCGSPRWVSASLDEGWTRIAQCIPCGAYGDKLGPGWRAEQAAQQAANLAASEPSPESTT